MRLDGFTKKSNSYAKIPSILLGIFAFILISNSFVSFVPSTEVPRLLIPPPPYMEHMVIGFQEVGADVMWIRAIQDLDYCDQKVSENTCRNQSWLYKMIDAITNLSPSFRTPYAAGALALTIIISDIEGATKIFDKAVAQFPNDGEILFNAAYQYLYEVKDNKKAADLLIRAGKNGGPPYSFALAGRLYSDEGRLDLAESLLQQMIAEKQDEQFINRLRDKIAQIKSESKSNKASQ